MFWLPAVGTIAMALSGMTPPVMEEVPVSASEVQSILARAAEVRRSLYAEVHATEPHPRNFVNVTVYGGLPPPSRFTMYLVPSGSSFRAEVVTQDPAFDGLPKPIRRIKFDVGREASRKIASLLNSSALWIEEDGLSARCTDQPAVTFEAAWGSKRRGAVRLDCAGSDLTGSLISVALSQANKR
jgi:hypothetical protein